MQGNSARSNDKLVESIRVAIDSAQAAGNHPLVAELLSILKKVPVTGGNQELHPGTNLPAEIAPVVR